MLGADFETVLAKEPRHFVATAGWARAHEQLGDLEKARAGYETAFEVAVTDWQRVEGLVGLAGVLRRLGRVVESDWVLTRAGEINPLAGPSHAKPR